jgi:hypothetical protein
MNGITTFISRGAEIAFSRGMIVVASAGNEGGTSNPHIERRPMRYLYAMALLIHQKQKLLSVQLGLL